MTAGGRRPSGAPSVPLAPPPHITRADLCALTRKYAVLAALRKRRDLQLAVDRSALKVLAARFPGALRELDTLGALEIARRARAASVVANGGASEPWMAWIIGFHKLMRATLAVRAEVGPGSRATRRLPAMRAHRLARRAALQSGFLVDAAFIRSVLDPAQGRLVALVLQRLASAFSCSPETISDALFPRRRPRSDRSGGDSR